MSRKSVLTQNITISCRCNNK